MNPKTTAVLFVIAAALASFVYFYEIQGEPARVKAKAAEKRLFPSVEQADISSISLKASGGPEIRLERHDGHWRITAPIDFVADTFAADGVASAITQLMNDSVIDHPEPPDVYGFRSDGPEVRFTAGGVEKVLHIGSTTPVGSNTYASVGGDDRVYTVATYQLSSFKKGVDEFRDKRILDFDPDAVDRVTIRWPEAKVVVVRSDGKWQMVEPIETLADADTVEQLLTSLSFLRAAGFVDEPGPDEKTGLASPQFAVELELRSDTEGAEPKTVRLAVGGVDESGSHRFARGALKSLYLISNESLDGFPRRVVDYRDRRLSEFDADAAKRIELGFHTSAGETVDVRIDRKDGAWVSDGKPVRSEPIDALVDALSHLRAHDIVAERLGPDELAAMGLDPAKLVLLVYPAGDGAARLAEVDIGAQFGGGVTARVPDRETIFQIDSATAAAFPKDLDDYRARFVAQPKAATDQKGAAADRGEDKK